MVAVIDASTRQRIIGVVMVCLSLGYLTQFVTRGWIAHDEGMLAEAAERVLLGEVPHVDYEEPYTGALSLAYAAVFRISGIELLHIRWVLFAVAVASVWLIYLLLRRFLTPLAAAFGVWIGLAWSFPNYFAGLPSWWLLLCALGCLYALFRYVEQRDWQYLALAAASAGVAVAIKQTGIYLVIALVLVLVYDGTLSSPVPIVRRALSVVTAGAAMLFAIAILRSRLVAAEGLYLFTPIVACSTALVVHHWWSNAAPSPNSMRRWLVVAAGTLLPIALLVVPYVMSGHVGDFVYGAFVLPRKRLTYAALLMPSPMTIVTGIPLIGLFMPPRGFAAPHSRHPVFLKAIVWTAAVFLPLLALWSARVYQLEWQSTRAFVVVIPVAICYRLIKGDIENAGQRTILYALAAVLAWMSLNQYPFAGPIYFCYVTPIAVVATAALATSNQALDRYAVLPWAVMLLLFATLSMNRSYVEQLGIAHVPRHFDTPLNLPRAHLSLEARDVTVYRRTLTLIEQHMQNGRLIAGPDTPVLYYLAGRQSDSGRLFDFFSGSESTAADEWSRGQVIVVNHRPAFSPAPTPDMMAELRRDFREGEQVGSFEVRWH